MMQFGLNYSRKLCNFQIIFVTMAHQPSALPHVATAAEQAKSGSKRLLCGSPVAIAPEPVALLGAEGTAGGLEPAAQLEVATAAEQAQSCSQTPCLESPLGIAPRPVAMLGAAVMAGALQPVAPLEASDIAGQWFLSVHPKDIRNITEANSVPLHVYGATGKAYIGFREDAEAADDRAMQLFRNDGKLARATLHLLKIQFSHKGFSYYATRNLGQDYAFDTMFHKNIYHRDRTGTDYGAWSFHGDLPLVESDEEGNLLIITEWIDR